MSPPVSIDRMKPHACTAPCFVFTRTGDANVDGIVNDDDVTIVGASYAPGIPKPSWALGDFDYNGFVDDDDVTLLGAFYSPSASPLAVTAEGASIGAVPVPEPSMLALLCIVITAIVIVSQLRDRRRLNAQC
jgi:hypothetical protein